STPAAASGTGGPAPARRVVAAQPQPVPADLANFSCTRRRGVWSASGDISNSAREPMVYTLTVVTIAGADVAGEDTERVRLRPGESTGFELPAISRGAAETCSPRLVRVPR
ncbi:MAG: hypothetical protein M3165_05840, partial [Actinomycetota bacterium]|nr:hypothetical protein [Actinomycetota bacterium]